MDAPPRRWIIIQILVVSGDGTLLNQVPFDGSRQRAENWAEIYRTACLDEGMDADFSFRFINEG